MGQTGSVIHDCQFREIDAAMRVHFTRLPPTFFWLIWLRWSSWSIISTRDGHHAYDGHHIRDGHHA